MFIKTGPEMLGEPVSRLRIHGAGIALKHMVWTGPSDSEEVARDFHRLFGRSLELNGDVYFADRNRAYVAEHMERLMRHKVFIDYEDLDADQGLTEESIVKSLPHWAALRLYHHLDPTNDRDDAEDISRLLTAWLWG